jgi:biotin transport system substrate-specific component
MHPTVSGNALAITLLPGNTALRYAWLAFLAVAGTVVLTLAAKTQVPFWPVPMTLQTLAVFAIGAAYGLRLGVATLVLYLMQGAMGFPVFAGTPEKGIGLAYMAGPTGGYLLGFVVMAAIAGWAADRGWSRNPLKLGGAMLLGEVVMLALGALWLSYLFGFEKGIAFGVGPFIVTDVIKLALAACLVPALWSLVERIRS